MIRLSYWILALVCFREAGAFQLEVPPDLSGLVLSETVPLALAPNGFTAEDFQAEWTGTPIPGVSLELGKKSLQWVRVVDVLRIPRGRLIVEASGYDSGAVETAGYIQTFASGHAEFPVALTTHLSEAPIRITLKKGSRTFTSGVRIRFRPRVSDPTPVAYDSSCSRFLKDPRVSGSASDEWIYVGCRLSVVGGSEHVESSLELVVYWDGATSPITFDGFDVRAVSKSVWVLRLKSSPGVVHLASSTRSLEMTYTIPERFQRGAIGVGLGPYYYSLHTDVDSVSTFSVVPTIYGSYFINELLRVVAFVAVTTEGHWGTDTGLHVQFETLRFLDRRLGISVLLGGHAIGAVVGGQYGFAFNAPQGLELSYTDFLSRGFNLTAGAFVYPLINGISYTNGWLRWGGGGWFGEANYIAWQQNIGNTSAASTSVGLSIGFPFKLRF